MLATVVYGISTSMASKKRNEPLEYVVLVNERNKPIGKALKSSIHTSNTPLHRGFSVFLFNPRGQLLLQQRSRRKKTWPLTWSNTCCGHPMPGEKSVDAAQRRLWEELGLRNVRLWNMLPNFRYRAEQSGIVENEICPVFIGFSDTEPTPDKKEVKAVRWVPWNEVVREAKKGRARYSPWCVEEVILLNDNQEFQRLLSTHTSRS